MSDTNTTPYPFDFEALQKGDMITRDQIVAALGRPVVGDAAPKIDDARFRLLAMQLGEMIENQRPDLLVRMQGDSLRIMHDLEADQVTAGRCVKAVRSIGRNARRRAAIDRAQFTEEELRVAQTNDRAITALAVMTRRELTKARRELLLAGKPLDPGEEESEDD